MASRRKILLWGAAVLAAITLLVVKVQHDFGRGTITISFQPLETTLKKAASDVVVAKHSNSPAVPANLPSGYLLAYERNPEGFKADAKLFDTWSTAIQLAQAVLKRGPQGNWVKNSSAIDLVKAENRVDPWGHSLCLMRRGDAVLVISGGPSAPGSPVCQNVGMTAADLRKFPRGKLLQSPTGSLVLVDFVGS